MSEMTAEIPEYMDVDNSEMVDQLTKSMDIKTKSEPSESKEFTESTDSDEYESKDSETKMFKKKQTLLAVGFRTHINKMNLQDTKTIPNSRLYKTRYCRTVGTGRKCMHAECHFAHSTEELCEAPCNFGDRCRCVRRSGMELVNTGPRVCMFIHPKENVCEFYNRTGIPTPLQRYEQACEENRKWQEGQSKRDSQESKQEKRKQDTTKSKTYTRKSSSTITTPKVSTTRPTAPVASQSPQPDETILYVPSEKAVQAFTLAMQMGTKRITIILTDV